jgi:DNA modification methylase
MSYRVITGDSAEELKKFKDNSIDAVITDPPYGIEFLAKEWDRNTGAVEIWQECLRVLKPGGYLLAFSAARTYHNLATNIESVGFDIRDQIMWLYASGFPKAQDIGKSIQRRQGVKKYEYRDKTDGYNLKNQKGFTENNDVGYGKMKGIAVPTSPEAQQWSGWKTALKPAHEPICMARKPMQGSHIDNVLAHGVGALNIDESRIPWQDTKDQKSAEGFNDKYEGVVRDGGPTFQGTDATETNPRIPKLAKRGTYKDATVFKDGCGFKPEETPQAHAQGRFPSNVIGEVAGYQKYFYCPKVTRRERHRGFEQDTIPAPFGDVKGAYQDGERFAAVSDREGHAKMGNNHPTVKPVELMKYLVKLVAPQGSHILDPFCGSGSTGMACKELGYEFTGIEMDKSYSRIAKRRIAATKTDPRERLFE